MKTTLKKIRAHSPCTDGWKKLLKHLGKTQADDEPLSIATVLDSNGLNDALWCLRAVEGCDREIRLFAVWCARQVQHLMTDERSIKALDVSEQFANGDATQDELAVASAAASTAAWDADWAASAAARYAARAARAASAAACSAARDAESAARAAAEAAKFAAWAAANDAARAAQEKELRRICAECEK